MDDFLPILEKQPFIIYVIFDVFVTGEGGYVMYHRKCIGYRFLLLQIHICFGVVMHMKAH